MEANRTSFVESTGAAQQQFIHGSAQGPIQMEVLRPC